MTSISPTPPPHPQKKIMPYCRQKKVSQTTKEDIYFSNQAKLNNG